MPEEMTAATGQSRAILSVGSGSSPGAGDGTRVTRVSDRADVQRADPVAFSIDPRVADRERELVSRCVEHRRLRSPEAFVLELTDGIVDVDLGVAMDAEGRLFNESVHSWKALARGGYEVSKTRENYSRAGVEVEDGGPAGVVLGTQDNANRVNWMLASLPRVALFRAAAASADPVRFVTPGLEPWQRAWLQAVGVDDAEILESAPGKHLRFERLFFPSSGFFRLPQFNAGALDALRRLPGPADGEPVRVFATTWRNSSRAAEASALEAMSRRLGFRSVYIDREPPARLVAMFARAEAVLAFSGPDLLPAAFSPAGCRVLEVAPEGLEAGEAVQAWSLATVLQQEYGCFVAPRATNGSDEALDIELDHLFAFLDQAMAPTA